MSVGITIYAESRTHDSMIKNLENILAKVKIGHANGQGETFDKKFSFDVRGESSPSNRTSLASQ